MPNSDMNKRSNAIPKAAKFLSNIEIVLAFGQNPSSSAHGESAEAKKFAIGRRMDD